VREASTADLASVRPEVQALPRYHFEAREAAVKLDQNEAPDDLPEEIRAAAEARWRGLAWNRYPAMHDDELAARLAARHGWDPEGVVVSGGSNVLIQALVILSGIGREVLTLEPSFSLYALQARLFGSQLRSVPLADARDPFPLAPLQAILSVGAGVAFLPVPLAPTGEGVPSAAVARLARSVAPGWTLVIDEAYGEFAHVDHAQVAAAHPNLVRLRTLSKAFGAAGARVGYALAHPPLAAELRKVLLPFSLSSLQSAVAHVLLDRPEVVDARVAMIIGERARLTAELRARGVQVRESVTNFLLLQVGDAGATHEALWRRGVLVRRQDHLPGVAGGLRVSIGSIRENEAFLAAWDEVQWELGGRSDVGASS
jgi:histidinol-phosphate aminotransferase